MLRTDMTSLTPSPSLYFFADQERGCRLNSGPEITTEVDLPRLVKLTVARWVGRSARGLGETPPSVQGVLGRARLSYEARQPRTEAVLRRPWPPGPGRVSPATGHPVRSDTHVFPPRDELPGLA